MDQIRVLCVEDNPAILRSLKIALNLHGFDVITACHGLEGLKQYRTHSGKFAAIVTDNAMPEMNGLEFVRSIREEGFRGPVFLMSGYLKTEDAEAYYRHGISGFFRKPFGIKTLAPLIELSLLTSIISQKK